MAMTCKNCGERYEGDGYSLAFHCPDADIEDWPEPDANPVDCKPESTACDGVEVNGTKTLTKKILEAFCLKYEPNNRKYVDEGLFDICYDAFKDEDLGIREYLVCSSYWDILFQERSDREQYVDDVVDFFKDILKHGECVKHYLAKDKLIYIYYKDNEDCAYSEQAAFLLSKALDQCTPF